MFTSIAGRSVIVTGATKGIGKGIAQVFARAGANVLITGRNEKDAASTAQELSSLGSGRVTYFLGDVTDRESTAAMAAMAVEHNGGIDVLCANAGIFPASKLVDMSESDMDLVLDTNIKGTLLSVQACIPALSKSGRGRVILTSSITGPYTGFPGWSHYGDYRRSMEMSIPQRRLGEVADIGNAALFFATDEAAYITGQALVIDGGQVLPESMSALEAMD